MGGIKDLTWKDVGNGVAKVAPWIGSLLGGPAGAAVGNLVSEVLGTEPNPAAISAELAKNPEAFLKLREMEISHAGKLAELQSLDYRAGLDFQKAETAAEIDDRKKARERDRDFQQKGVTNYRANLMIVADVVGLIACLIIMTTYKTELPAGVNSILGIVASVFALCLRDAHQFEFGSSRGSRDKDLIIAASPPMPQGATDPR